MTPASGRIVVAGDWHAHTRWATRVIEAARDAGIDKLIHVGDFGLGLGPWNYERDVEQAAALAGVTLHIVPGNHDNHDLIDELAADAGRRDEDGFAKLSEHVRFTPRAHTWQWEHRRFASLMGAYSIDQRWRTAGVDWWPQEEPTFADLGELLRLTEAKQIDVLIGHDVPAGTPTKSSFTLPPQLDAESRRTQALLAQAVQALQPPVVFSGHWHQRLTHEIPAEAHPTRVEVLDKEDTTGNAVVLDLATLEVSPLPVEPLPRTHIGHPAKRR